jgi:hypothetical protein
MRTATSYEKIAGLVFILYGILKLAAVFAIHMIPPNVRERVKDISGINTIIIDDTTTAGNGIELIFVVFALFSIVHGCALMKLFPKPLNTLIESRLFQYSFYIGLGVTTMLFYTLVLYTNVPIQKDPENNDMYWIYGYIIGVSFICVPIVWELLSVKFPDIFKMSVYQHFVMMTCIFFVFFFIANIVYYVMEVRKKKRNRQI